MLSHQEESKGDECTFREVKDEGPCGFGGKGAQVIVILVDVSIVIQFNILIECYENERQ